MRFYLFWYTSNVIIVLKGKSLHLLCFYNNTFFIILCFVPCLLAAIHLEDEGSLSLHAKQDICGVLLLLELIISCTHSFIKGDVLPLAMSLLCHCCDRFCLRLNLSSEKNKSKTLALAMFLNLNIFYLLFKTNVGQSANALICRCWFYIIIWKWDR